MGHLLPARTPGLRTVTLRERPELLPEFERLADQGWPRFMLGWKQPGGLPGRRAFLEGFADCQLALLDDAGSVVAVGNTLPFAWDGKAASLPASILELKRNAWVRGPATALAALAALVDPRRRGEGASRALLEAMAELTVEKGLSAFVAPVRPTLKSAYALTPTERYARWTDSQGLPFDPWLRTHVRMGAEVLGLMPRALDIAASVEEWEDWTGLRFPESGDYVVPGALAPLAVDRGRGEARYVEPNVWVRHRLER